MDNISREVEIPPKKNYKEMLEIKNIITEIKNTLDSCFSRLNIPVERTSDLENTSIESLKTKRQREQNEN